MTNFFCSNELTWDQVGPTPGDQVVGQDGWEPDDPEPECDGKEEEDEVHLGDVLHREASEDGHEEWESDVEDYQESVVDRLQRAIVPPHCFYLSWWLSASKARVPKA